MVWLQSSRIGAVHLYSPTPSGAQHGAVNLESSMSHKSADSSALFNHTGPWDPRTTSMVRECLKATHADSTNQRIFRWVHKVRAFAADEDQRSGTVGSILPMSTDAKFLKTIEALVYKGGRDGGVVSQSELEAFVNAVDQIHVGIIGHGKACATILHSYRF